jgi:hypothetical protein
MNKSSTWVTACLALLLLLDWGLPLTALAGYGRVRREWQEGTREIRRERREAIREIRNADSPAEFRRAIREGRREVRREIRRSYYGW